ncbi:MAG: hemerythrin domain-containing protein [Acidiferrobacter sp.]
MPSDTLSSFLSAQHRELNHLLETTDNACGTPEAPHALARFRESMERHLDLEERLLFPPFEERAGYGGPLLVMRHEHDDIRALLSQAHDSLAAQDRKGCSQVLDTLTVLVQQHHLKEENVLYPMSDNLLADHAEGLLQAMVEATNAYG